MDKKQKKYNLDSAISPYKKTCKGYGGEDNYVNAFILEIGKFPKQFSHKGSSALDEIMAYDNAEIEGAFIGQVNMTFVSSFSGPQGIIWGYDIAKKEEEPVSKLLDIDKLKEFKGIKFINGENLRIATRSLFGTVEDKHFPLHPGTHVPCAGGYYTKEGKATLYGAFAIGVPENRKDNACLLMEDMGELTESSSKEDIIINLIKSVLEIGKNQKISFKDIIIDFSQKTIEENEYGCVLSVMPYFLMARDAYDKKLCDMTLEEWEVKKL